MAIERELSKLWILLTRVNMINTADEQVQRRADLDIDKQLVTQSSRDTCVYLDRQWVRFFGGVVSGGWGGGEGLGYPRRARLCDDTGAMLLAVTKREAGENPV